MKITAVFLIWAILLPGVVLGPGSPRRGIDSRRLPASGRRNESQRREKRNQEAAADGPRKHSRRVQGPGRSPDPTIRRIHTVPSNQPSAQAARGHRSDQAAPPPTDQSASVNPRRSSRRQDTHQRKLSYGAPRGADANRPPRPDSGRRRLDAFDYGGKFDEFDNFAGDYRARQETSDKLERVLSLMYVIGNNMFGRHASRPSRHGQPSYNASVVVGSRTNTVAHGRGTGSGRRSGTGTTGSRRDSANSGRDGGTTSQFSARPSMTGVVQQQVERPYDPNRPVFKKLKRSSDKYDPLPKFIRDQMTKGRKIGEGSYGKIYRVQLVQGGPFMALKLMTYKNAEHRLRRMRREIDIMYTLQTRYNMRAVERYMDEHAEEVYVVMELAPFGDGFDMVTKMRAFFTAYRHREFMAKLVIRDMLRGLMELHSYGYVHHDVKIENILIMRDHVAVTDFGLCKPLERNKYQHDCQGTIEYLPPEYVPERKTSIYDDRGDLWGVGVIVIEIIFGKSIFKHRKEEAIIHKIRHFRGYPIPSAFSRELDDFVKRTLAPLDKRFKNAYDMYMHPWLNDVRYLELNEQNSPWMDLYLGVVNPSAAEKRLDALRVAHRDPNYGPPKRRGTH